MGTAAALDNDLKGTSDLKVRLNNSNAMIMLDDSNGIALPSANHRSPTGMTAMRFTSGDDSGVIATNLKKSADIRQSYTKYFFSVWSADGDQTFKADADLSTTVTGVTLAAGAGSTGILTFGSTASFAPSSFGSSAVPSAVAAGGSRPVTFLGVTGTLACPTGGTACTATTAEDGKFSFANSPTFTPAIPPGKDLSDLIVTDQVASTEYLTFGYWLDNSGSGSSLRHSIDTYAKAHGYDELSGAITTTGTDITGSATYSGGAAGVYVLREGTNPTGNGEFVADVDLTAQFGNTTGTVPAAEQWKITGTVDSFQSATSNHNLDAWTLRLSADLGTRAAATGIVSSHSFGLGNAVTTGGGPNGKWTAALYGNNAAISDDDPRLDIQAIVGEFDGHFTNGSVVGAFGTTRD